MDMKDKRRIRIGQKQLRKDKAIKQMFNDARRYSEFDGTVEELLLDHQRCACYFRNEGKRNSAYLHCCPSGPNCDYCANGRLHSSRIKTFVAEEELRLYKLNLL